MSRVALWPEGVHCKTSECCECQGDRERRRAGLALLAHPDFDAGYENGCDVVTNWL